MRFDLILKHKHPLDILVWDDDIKCPFNPGIPDLDGNLEDYIYVDDILASVVNKPNILRLLAGTIEAIYTVCNHPNIEICQCPLSLEKWEELLVGLC
jgi:hypothetical protein